MHPAALLQRASELVEAVLRLQQPADREVAGFFRSHRALGSRERHTLAETTYAVLRQKNLLVHLAKGGPGPLARRLAMLAWQGDPVVLSRALDEPDAAWLDAARAIDTAALPPPLRHHLPDWLAQRLEEAFGSGAFPALAASLNEPAPLDLRVNVLKAGRGAVQAALAAEGTASEASLWSPWGLRVSGKPALQRSAVFARGEVEVQDEGSQLLALLTGAGRGELVVDFCAGAGGKTLALGAMMRNTGRLYAFDTSSHRLAALQPRLQRSGLSQVHPMVLAHENDERVARLHGKVDRVLVDAPCSGLGTLRRNPDLKWRQSPSSVTSLSERQHAILEAAARLPRPSGRLVYATCSLLPEENEAVAEAFTVEQAGRFQPVPAQALLDKAGVPDAQALTEGPWMRLRPDRHATDGYFAAVWQRR